MMSRELYLLLVAAFADSELPSAGEVLSEPSGDEELPACCLLSGVGFGLIEDFSLVTSESNSSYFFGLTNPLKPG